MNRRGNGTFCGSRLRYFGGLASLLLLAACADATSVQPAAKLEISPAVDTAYVGDTLHLKAMAFTADGKPTSAAVTWSSDSTFLSIDTQGNAVARGLPGSEVLYSTTATASAGGLEAHATVVIARPIARAWPAVSSQLLAGRSMPLHVRYSFGSPSGWEAPNVVWTSSDTTIVSIANHAALGKRSGTSLLTARANGWMDTVRLQVVSTGYAVTYLGTLGGSYSRALDINDAGQVVGNSSTAAGDTVAFRWQAGSMSAAGGFQLPQGSALIDAQGRVVGSAALPAPPQGVVTAVSDLGQTAGYWAHGGSVDSAFATRGGIAHRLPQAADCPGGSATLFGPRPAALNDLGDVVGSAQVVNCWVSISAIHWYPSGHTEFWGSSTLLPITATAVNNAGDYLESIYLPSSAGRSRSGDIVQAGVRIPIGSGVPTQDVIPLDLNDQRQVVGSSYFFNGNQMEGFVWQGGGLSNLSVLTKDADWVVLEANAINESGQIVGVGRNVRTGQTGAILLTPAP